MPEWKLLISNNFTDLIDYREKNSKDESSTCGCTAFAVSDNERMVFGQTWDMGAYALPYVVSIKIMSTPQIEILTCAGSLALCGVNEYGLGVFINNLKTNEIAHGLIMPALVKKMLTMKNSLEALCFIQNNLPSSGHNYLICDPDRMISVETTGKQYEVIHNTTSSDCYFHTNHFLSATLPEIKPKYNSTYARYGELTEYFTKTENKAPDMNKLVCDVMSGAKNPSVCRKSGVLTCGGMIYDTKERKGIVYHDHNPFDESKKHNFHF